MKHITVQSILKSPSIRQSASAEFWVDANSPYHSALVIRGAERPFPAEGAEVLALPRRAPAYFHRARALLQAIHTGLHKGTTGCSGSLV